MKVSGFSFIRNAIKYDYPIVEAIRSVLPLCDDFYIAVGKSDDETLRLVGNIDPKIIIKETVWDDNLREGGKVLADETNKALAMIPDDTDWCLYIQGDEAIHEKDHQLIRQSMLTWLNHDEVDGLLFKYRHFFGSYDYMATAYNWYRNEIRIIRNNRDIFSYRDAQGFRKGDNRKLNVKPIDAVIYHYGWVKHPETQLKKIESFHKLYTNRKWDVAQFKKNDGFDYNYVETLERFEGEHPSAIKDRIARINWEFEYDISMNRRSFKGKFKHFFEKYFGIIPGEYRNYRLI